jgi:hypothetical protein
MARTVTQKKGVDRTTRMKGGRADPRDVRSAKCEILRASGQRPVGPRTGLLRREHLPTDREEHQLAGAVILPLLDRRLPIGKRQMEPEPSGV